MRSSVITVGPTQAPVNTDDLKERLKYSDNDYDSTFLSFIQAAVEYCQEYAWAQFCTATYVDRFDGFCGVMELQRNPVQSVTSVQYVDTGGATQTLTANTDYTVDIYAKPCRIVPAYTKYWPATRGHLNDVIVTYMAGYGSPSSVPDEIKNAVLLKAGAMYEQCDASAIDKAVHAMLDKRSFKVFY